MWLGIRTFTRPAVPQAGMAQQSTSWARWAFKGACVSGLNPKVTLLFLALLPQFVDPSALWPVPLQIVALGLVHIISSGIVYLLVGHCSQAVLKTWPVAAALVSRASGAAMVAIAMLLLADQFLPR
ncbi:LysE family transporter [Cobetia sp. 1CM21F]|nr:LysE family transporter [Cobetia sp. 1CM21F]